MEFARAHVLVCGGTGCTSSGSVKIIEEFERCLKEKDLEKEVKVIRKTTTAKKTAKTTKTEKTKK